MKTWWAFAFGAVFALLLAGVIKLVSSPPRGEPVELLPAPTAPPLAVHVAGAVVQPGVYTFQPGSRVSDAIRSAGGLLPDAEAGALNLAAFLEDGERVWVPSRIVEEMPSKAAAPVIPLETQVEGSAPGATPQFPININTATQAELESLPAIGPVIAGRIVTYRQEHGLFSDIEQIQDVAGIGPATFEKIKDLITVGGSP